MTHKSNTLKFWIKTWCLSYLCDCSWHNVDDPHTTHDPTKFKIKTNHRIQRLKLHVFDMIFLLLFKT